MSLTFLSLLGFAAWTLAMAAIVVGWRAVQVVARGRGVDSFPADREHEGTPFYKRAMRVHLNCAEHLPVYVAIVLVAAATGGTGLTDPLAMPLLALRVVQSCAHLTSVRAPAVWVRFGAFLGQWVLMVTMIFRLVTTG